MVDVLLDLTPLDTFSRYSGTGRYVHELGLALKKLTDGEREGLEFAALTSLDGELGRLDWSGSASLRFALDQEVRWLNLRRSVLVRTLRRIKPRLFHAIYHLGTPRGSGVPRVVSCLDLVQLVLHRDYLPGRHFYRRMLRAVETLRFRSATRVQSISQHSADDLMRLCGVPASNIDIVYLGVDLERYRCFDGADDQAAEVVRRRYGLQKEAYIFYVGAADPRKNVDTLIHSFAAAKVEGLSLILIGKMRDSDQRAIDLALAQSGAREVRQLGFVPDDDLPAIMNGALALVFCSTYEGFGNVPIEAMACGCPVIHTGLTSMRETIGDAGLVVGPRDCRTTAEAIRSIARDGALGRELRRAGLVRAQRFSWRRTALATVDSYTRAMRGSS